ncbi:MAG: HAD family phosphatase [Ruminococcaceae bacterium]|nr:HAD family phosphatase [Oscillospiraceae bacterium]
MIKLIAFDMDYTLLKTGGALSSVTEETLKKADEQGLLLVPVTGRNRDELQKLLPKLHARYAVTVNGATVLNLSDNSVLYQQLAPVEDMLEYILKAESMDIYTEVYSGKVCTNPFCYENMEALGMPPDQVPLFQATRTVVPSLYDFAKERGGVEKLHLVFHDVPDKEKRQHIFLGNPDFSYTSAYVNNLELCSNKVNKATGLAALIEHLGIAPEEVMALGDGANDASMLQFAGLGVAVSNAVPEAKEAADVITLSNDEDGAAIAIQKYALNQS